MENGYYVYLVECADSSFYCGISSDVEKRIHSHNHLSSGAKYTRSRRPVKLVYQSAAMEKSEALKEEHRIKRLNRQQKCQLIEKYKVR